MSSDIEFESQCLKELPEEIGKLIHLRYMDLSFSECLKELPDSLCSLYNLQTLLLNNCYALEKLPKAMRKLINLKHLYVAYSDKLEYLPKGIGRLKSLRALDYYYIPREGNGDEALRLGDLGIMEQLQGSIIINGLGNAEDVSEVEKASFGNKQDLLSLTLCFQGGRSHEEILKAVQPHKNLEFLGISYCHAASSWSECLYWINSLHNLRFLCLHFWKFCEDLPPLGQLPSLEILEIWGMKKVKKVGFEFWEEKEETLAGGILFPKLKSLRISWMIELEEWEGTTRGAKEITVMPRLSSLEISLCPYLKALPDFLQNIKALSSLEIIDCSSLRRENEWPKIYHIPNIKFNDSVNDRFEDWRAQQTDGGGNVMEVTATEEEDQSCHVV